MFSIPEQFTAATKTHFESQLAVMNALTAKAFEAVSQVIDLNLNVAKSSMEESTANAKQLLTAKDPQEFLTLTTAQTQPNAEKASAYGRQLAGIASASQSEFTKAAEEQVAESKRKIVEMMDELSNNAPAGSEAMITMMKSMFGNANASYEQFSKSTKQAVETLDNNVATAVQQFTQAAEKTTARTVKK